MEQKQLPANVQRHKVFSQKRSAQCAVQVITCALIRKGTSAGECVCDFHPRPHTWALLPRFLLPSAGGGGGLLGPGLPRAGVPVHSGGGGRVLPTLRCRPLPG